MPFGWKRNGYSGNYYRFIDGEKPAFAEYRYRKQFQKFALAEGGLKAEHPFVRKAAEFIALKFPEALPKINTESWRN